MRLTKREVEAVLQAVTGVTAGELDADDGWPDALAKALFSAEEKLQTELAHREKRERQI